MEEGGRGLPHQVWKQIDPNVADGGGWSVVDQ